ncbi:MAG: hypothetical protein DI537_17575 [Stutzerimonas stutzeri]|nr:MAG: hypothetical protein DI537_17575 [Stutzerimonas stutzeri]
MRLTRQIACFCIFAAANLVLGVAARAESQSQFSRVEVRGLLSIEVPRHWDAKDADTRANLSASAEALSGIASHVSSLAISSLPRPTAAIIRVSRTASDGLTQSGLRAAAANTAQFLRDAEAEMSESFAQMDANIKKLGGALLQKPAVSLDTIDGRTAMVISYRRVDANGTTFFVRQFHVPLTAEKALITISNREHDAILYKPILERVLRSIDFDVGQ